MPHSTRRVLVPVTGPGGKVGRGLLLPNLQTAAPSSFVRIPGGRDVSFGMVAFVGECVTAEDMLTKWESRFGAVIERDRALELLGGYVRWASTQKLGTVFEAAYDSAGKLVPRKIAASTPALRVPLPP